MKRFKISIVALLVFATLVVSCKKQDEEVLTQKESKEAQALDLKDLDIDLDLNFNSFDIDLNDEQSVRALNEELVEGIVDLKLYKTVTVTFKGDKAHVELTKVGEPNHETVQRSLIKPCPAQTVTCRSAKCMAEEMHNILVQERDVIIDVDYQLTKVKITYTFQDC